MIVSTTRNLSKLAELMGNAYTEVDAKSFAAHLIEQHGVTNTDDVDDAKFFEALGEWEAPEFVT